MAIFIGASATAAAVDPASARQITLEAIRDRADFPLPEDQLAALTAGSASGDIAVTNFPANFPLPSAQLDQLTPFEPPEVYPVIGTVALDASTLAALEQTTVNVSFPSTQAVSGTVAVSNLPATQPVSGTVALDSATLAALESTGVSVSNFPASFSVSNFPAQPAAYDVSPATLAVTATAAAGQAVTLTLPAVAGQFHYVTAIQVIAYATAARTGGATPTVVTTTNLPGTPALTFPSAQAVGTIAEQRFDFPMPFKSSAANTATTIVAPATASVIWRINVFYRTAA